MEIFTTSKLMLLKKALKGFPVQLTVKDEFPLQSEPIPNGYGMVRLPHFSWQPGFESEAAVASVELRNTNEMTRAIKGNTIPSCNMPISSSIHLNTSIDITLFMEMKYRNSITYSD